MIFTKEELYAINYLNDSNSSIFNIDCNLEELVEIIDIGCNQLALRGLLTSLDEEFINAGIYLQRYVDSDDYLIIGNLKVAFSKRSPFVIVLEEVEEGYDVNIMPKGLVLIDLVMEAPFLQRFNKVVESELRRVKLSELKAYVNNNASILLKYYCKGKLEYNCLLIDFYDRILEYNLDSGFAKSVGAMKIKNDLLNWTKVGKENERFTSNKL